MDSSASLSPPPVLKPVEPGDDAFLESVYASTRAEELAQVPWTPEQKAAFCQMQFIAQDTDYRRNYPYARYYIVVFGSTQVGRLIVDRRENVIHILDIALLPEHRGQGIGTHLLLELQAEARAAGLPLSIHVELFNPARHLYERLGFRAVEEHGVYLLMRWP